MKYKCTKQLPFCDVDEEVEVKKSTKHPEGFDYHIMSPNATMFWPYEWGSFTDWFTPIVEIPTVTGNFTQRNTDEKPKKIESIRIIEPMNDGIVAHSGVNVYRVAHKINEIIAFLNKE
jgi:hypothetical protein